MDEARFEALTKRIEELEAKVSEMETREADPGGVTNELHDRYPRGMTKGEAAEELGVTRQTVYAMLADGRLKENAVGRVVTKSVADAMYRGVIRKDKRRRGSRWTLRMGADDERK